MTSSSNRPRSKKSSRHRKKANVGAVQIKCKFCGNTFMAMPAQAVCVKCGRPANRKLDFGWLAAAFVIPFVGFVNSLLLRPHSPFASTQSLYAAIAGSALYVFGFGFLHGILNLF